MMTNETDLQNLIEKRFNQLESKLNRIENNLSTEDKLIKKDLTWILWILGLLGSFIIVLLSILASVGSGEQ